MDGGVLYAFVLFSHFVEWHTTSKMYGRVNTAVAAGGTVGIFSPQDTCEELTAVAFCE